MFKWRYCWLCLISQKYKKCSPAKYALLLYLAVSIMFDGRRQHNAWIQWGTGLCSTVGGADLCWGFRRKGLNTRLKVNINQGKLEHWAKYWIDWLKWNWSIDRNGKKDTGGGGGVNIVNIQIQPLGGNGFEKHGGTI